MIYYICFVNKHLNDLVFNFPVRLIFVLFILFKILAENTRFPP